MNAITDLTHTSTDSSVQDLIKTMESTIVSCHEKTLCLVDICKAEAIITETCKQITDAIWQSVLTLILDNKVFLNTLRLIAGRHAMRLVSYQTITVTLPTGTRCRVRSPFFIKARPRRGRKKKGPQNRGCHLALELLGFIGKTCGSLALRAIQLALIAPSFEVASKILKNEGIQMCPKLLRALIVKFAPGATDQRVERLINEHHDKLEGRRVMILVDGGRLRQRKNKRGRIPEGRKRGGYHTDWIEPKLLQIVVLDENGEPLKGYPPIVDGTTGKLPEFLRLLEQYLIRLKIHTCCQVTLCADGAPWIWDRIPALLQKVGVDPSKIVEVIDWTHAKQNLKKIFESIPKKKRKDSDVCFNDVKDLLYSVSIDELIEFIKEEFKLRTSSKAVKKLKSYFLRNKGRMQYQYFKNRRIPTGSGAIESAIRRVINLRLKAPGSFWKLEFANDMIYLRAQLLYGRWENLVKNRLKTLHQLFVDYHSNSLMKGVNPI
ncbi:MAG: hypothetical protein MI892_28085 [Desulfobacterales bacterium]|nr:hypothetical protein [Desulfobacterales bacterium]